MLEIDLYFEFQNSTPLLLSNSPVKSKNTSNGFITTTEVSKSDKQSITFCGVFTLSFKYELYSFEK